MVGVTLFSVNTALSATGPNKTPVQRVLNDIGLSHYRPGKKE
jgi:hypothetical protein